MNTDRIFIHSNIQCCNHNSKLYKVTNEMIKLYLKKSKNKDKSIYEVSLIEPLYNFKQDQDYITLKIEFIKRGK